MTGSPADSATSARKARRNASFSSVPCQLVPQVLATDQKRARLIGLRAQPASLGEPHSFGSGDQAATAAVEVQMARIRQALGLPPSSQGAVLIARHPVT
jgi:hypothetical protein